MSGTMAEFDQTCDCVLRAALQVSGLTGSAVSYEQVNDVVPLSRDEFEQVILALRTRGMVPQEPGPECIALTATGIKYASGLPPIPEPPLFQDI